MKLMKNILGFILFFIMGGVIGFFVGEQIIPLLDGQLDTMKIFGIFICLILSYYFSVFIHEWGHYYFGKLTNYTLTSFRVLRFLLIQEDGKWVWKKNHVPGTAGQCLMRPPVYNDGNFPFFWYNMGGAIMNLIIAALFTMICLIFKHPIIQILGINMIGINLLFALTNGIPLSVNGIVNDGHNMMQMKKNKENRWYFWLQLEVCALLANKHRYHEMPKEWFNVDENLMNTNSLAVAIMSMKMNYYMDLHQFEQAKQTGINILKRKEEIIGLYVNEIECELLFFKILDGVDIEEIKKEFKRLAKHIKLTKSYPCRIRLLYAYYLLVEKNEKRAQECVALMQQAYTQFPNRGDVELESEIMEYIEQKNKMA